ncbi:hypothetical protein D3C71_2026390 [compost metagenome]
MMIHPGRKIMKMRQIADQRAGMLHVNIPMFILTVMGSSAPKIIQAEGYPVVNILINKAPHLPLRLFLVEFIGIDRQ